jgi:hypothetical protein
MRRMLPSFQHHIESSLRKRWKTQRQMSTERAQGRERGCSTTWPHAPTESSVGTLTLCTTRCAMQLLTQTRRQIATRTTRDMIRGAKNEDIAVAHPVVVVSFLDAGHAPVGVSRDVRGGGVEEDADAARDGGGGTG